MKTIPVFQQFTHRLCVALLITSLPAACVRRLPPAAVPEPVAPPVQTGGAPAEGTGRLVVDVVEGPAPVQRVVIASTPGRDGGYVFSQEPHELCHASPCVTDVPVGNVLLGFPVIGNNDLEVEVVHVGPDPSVYRRSLSIYTDNTGTERTLGIIATSVGGASAITGTVLLPIGLAHDSSGLTTAGAVTLGAGALLLTLGILMIRHDAPTYRPGSSNHFPLGAR
jgi:hypothetical protein